MEKIKIDYTESYDTKENARKLLEQAYNLFERAEKLRTEEDKKIIEFVSKVAGKDCPMSATTIEQFFDGTNTYKIAGLLSHSCLADDCKVQKRKERKVRKYIECDDNGKPVKNGDIYYKVTEHNVYWTK